jgi:hypothetical protein
MFTIILVAINLATIAGCLIQIGEQRHKPTSEDDDNDDFFIPCC